MTDPRWRANLDARYSKGNWRASWSMQYVHHNLRVTPGSYSSNPGSISPIWNGSYTYHNFQVSYTFPRDSGLEVYIGMDNVFDKDPPLNYFGSDLGSSYYDAIGRYMYMGATYRF